MQTKKITTEDIADITVASLPTRPTSDYVYGGKGYSSDELKAAFDRLPIYIIEAFNTLLDDIQKEGRDSLAAAIPTGISDTHTLNDLFTEIKNGSFASRITINGLPLPTYLARLEGGYGI